jgi:urease alpha subunit
MSQVFSITADRRACTSLFPHRPRPNCPYDLIIRNGHIIAGTGSPWYSGDIGVRDGRIAAIGFLGPIGASQAHY